MRWGLGNIAALPALGFPAIMMPATRGNASLSVRGVFRTPTHGFTDLVVVHRWVMVSIRQIPISRRQTSELYRRQERPNRMPTIAVNAGAVTRAPRRRKPAPFGHESRPGVVALSRPGPLSRPIESRWRGRHLACGRGVDLRLGGARADPALATVLLDRHPPACRGRAAADPAFSFSLSWRWSRIRRRIGGSVMPKLGPTTVPRPVSIVVRAAGEPYLFLESWPFERPRGVKAQLLGDLGPARPRYRH